MDGQTFFPSRMEEASIAQGLQENLPLVQTRYEPAGLRVNQEAFAVQDAGGRDWLIAAYTIENPRGERRAAKLHLSLRPFNPEGAAIVRSIRFDSQADPAELRVNDELAALLPKPDSFSASVAEQGDAAFFLDAPNGISGVADENGCATFVASYALDLHPHTHRVITAVMPMALRGEANPQAAAWLKSDALPQLKRDFSQRWRKLLGQGMAIRVPDDNVQNAFDANKAHLLVLHDGDSITPGPFLYHEFWIRDAAYMLHALDQLGYHAQVKNVLKTLPEFLRKDGFIQSQEGEWDSNGQALWLLEQNARLSGDYELLHDQYWQMLNAAHWIDSARQKTKKSGARVPEHGLLPAGLSAEHLGPNDFYFWDDWWGLAGLRAAVFAAKLFNSPQDADKLQFAYDAFWRDVNDALARAATKNDALWMPAAPDRSADSAMAGNLAAVYPLQLLSPDDPRLLATIEELIKTSFVDGAFFHYVGHGGFGTYLALHLAGCLVYQRNPGAWDALRFLLKHASPTWTWGETIHPLTRRGGHGDGHHGWAAADVVSFIRNALLFEENDHLVLTPALPEEWVFETASIKVERAATCFGDVDMTLAFGERNATLVLKGRWREPPAYIEWNLPMELKNAGGNVAGVEQVDDHRVRFPANVTRVVATW